jgi:cytoskeletal protein CcmA (bactofilin family)
MFNNSSMDSSKNNDSFETVIGSHVKVEGTLTSQGNVRIEGQFKGTLEIGGKLHVGKDAKVDANIKAQTAFIAGTITGNMAVSDILDLSSTSYITGDVKASTVTMSAGAQLNGQCTMGGKGGMTADKQVSSPKS